jgi:hypothetical protein
LLDSQNDYIIKEIHLFTIVTSVLKVCDNLRDKVLQNLGVRLEDKEGQPPEIKLVDRETLLIEKEEKMKVCYVLMNSTFFYDISMLKYFSKLQVIFPHVRVCS